jgi:hypothetical protein
MSSPVGSNRREDAPDGWLNPMPYSKLIEQNPFTLFVRPEPKTSEPF